MLPEEIYKRIKAIRTHLELNQSEFGSKLSVMQNYISRIEKGDLEPSVKFIQNLYKVFNINIHWLITGEGSMLLNKIVYNSIVSDTKQEYKIESKSSDSEVKALREQVKELKIENKTLENLLLKSMDCRKKGDVEFPLKERTPART